MRRCCDLHVPVWQAELLCQADCMPEDGSLPVRVIAIQLLHVCTPQEEFAAVTAGGQLLAYKHTHQPSSHAVRSPILLIILVGPLKLEFGMQLLECTIASQCHDVGTCGRKPDAVDCARMAADQAAHVLHCGIAVRIPSQAPQLQE